MDSQILMSSMSTARDIRNLMTQMSANDTNMDKTGQHSDQKGETVGSPYRMTG
jgi:hypothetical protein